MQAVEFEENSISIKLKGKRKQELQSIATGYGLVKAGTINELKGRIEEHYYPEEMHATADLCGMMNCFVIALMGEAKWRVFIKEMKWYCHSVMSMISDFHGCLIHS